MADRRPQAGRERLDDMQIQLGSMLLGAAIVAVAMAATVMALHTC